MKYQKQQDNSITNSAISYVPKYVVTFVFLFCYFFFSGGGGGGGGGSDPSGKGCCTEERRRISPMAFKTARMIDTFGLYVWLRHVHM